MSNKDSVRLRYLTFLTDLRLAQLLSVFVQFALAMRRNGVFFPSDGEDKCYHVSNDFLHGWDFLPVGKEVFGHDALGPFHVLYSDHKERSKSLERLIKMTPGAAAVPFDQRGTLVRFETPTAAIVEALPMLGPWFEEISRSRRGVVYIHFEPCEPGVISYIATRYSERIEFFDRHPSQHKNVLSALRSHGPAREMAELLTTMPAPNQVDDRIFGDGVWDAFLDKDDQPVLSETITVFWK